MPLLFPDRADRRASSPSRAHVAERVALARLLCAVTLLVSLPLQRAAAQAPALTTVTGRVVDVTSGAALADVGVQVVGTTLGTQTGVDGRYVIRNVPSGTLTLQARRIGYQPKTVTGLMATSQAPVVLDIGLQQASVQLTAQVVTASAERGSVSAALDQQRTAIGVVNAVTQEQIARSPDADAAQAVQRVSGVTVQDGKYVFVRGLGERYTTASLNGARLPSPEPERKVVPLDLFPASLLQSVTTSKTFTPDQPGDFSGGQVDIRTREFPASRTISYTLSTGFNTEATGTRLPFAQRVGGEVVANANGMRNLPGLLAGTDARLSGATSSDYNNYINSFRNAWSPIARSAQMARSAGITVGGSDPVFGHDLGYVVSGLYSYNEEARVNQVRARAIPGSGGKAVETDHFVGDLGRASILWGGIFNLSTLIGSHSRLSLNNTYDRSADDDAVVERGALEALSDAPVRVQRMQYVERSVWSSQLAGEHELFARHRVDWAATFSGVSRREPDRSQFVQTIDTDPSTGREILQWDNSLDGAVRVFSQLDEQSSEGRANYQIELGRGAHTHRLRVGGLARRTGRDADNRGYNISANVIGDSAKALPAELLFDGRFTSPDSARLRLNAIGQGGSYHADDRIGAGFVMADLGLGARVRLVGGARYEQWHLAVDAQSTLGDLSRTRKDRGDVLPSLALNVAVSDAQNVRLSASRTLARPEYREISEVGSFDVIGGENIIGNPLLERTLIDNYDMRWELYPRSTEVLSLGVFAKRFQLPIERVLLPTSGGANYVTFNNAERADNVGVEGEVRLGLDRVTSLLSRLTVFSNVTVMRSMIHLGDAQASSTNASRAMVGQAPYVVNGGVTYASTRSAFSATALYNRVGDRLVAAGSQPLPDVVEHARGVLDLSLRFPAWSGFAARIDAKNLIDAPLEVTQGSVVRSSYRLGRTFSIGLSWTR